MTTVNRSSWQWVWLLINNSLGSLMNVTDVIHAMVKTVQGNLLAFSINYFLVSTLWIYSLAGYGMGWNWDLHCWPRRTYDYLQFS